MAFLEVDLFVNVPVVLRPSAVKVAGPETNLIKEVIHKTCVHGRGGGFPNAPLSPIK